MRHPVIITSLEEDFRAIGILPKEEAKKPEAEAEPEEPLEERTRKMRASGSRKMKKVKVGSSTKRREWRLAAKKRKSKIRAYRKSGKGKAAARKAKRFEDTSESTSARINSLLEDVQDIISTVDDEAIENAVKSFANVAIISEMLARVFEAVKDEFEEEDAQELGEAAEFFGELAEEAAGIATMLHEGVDEDTPEDEIPTYEDIEAKFQEHMDALIDGLELYADLTEDEDEEDPTEETDEEVEED